MEKNLVYVSSVSKISDMQLYFLPCTMIFLFWGAEERFGRYIKLFCKEKVLIAVESVNNLYNDNG